MAEIGKGFPISGPNYNEGPKGKKELNISTVAQEQIQKLSHNPGKNCLEGEKPTLFALNKLFPDSSYILNKFNPENKESLNQAAAHKLGTILANHFTNCLKEYE